MLNSLKISPLVQDGGEGQKIQSKVKKNLMFSFDPKSNNNSFGEPNPPQYDISAIQVKDSINQDIVHDLNPDFSLNIDHKEQTDHKSSVEKSQFRYQAEPSVVKIDKSNTESSMNNQSQSSDLNFSSKKSNEENSLPVISV